MSNNFMENNSFGFNESNNENSYEMINGLGQSDYENEDLFNKENVSYGNNESDVQLENENLDDNSVYEYSNDNVNNENQEELLNVFEANSFN